MKFAQFQSTYKPLPLDVYERTGQELEEKYYRNREQSSQLRQALSNTKVEDRNIGALAKATTDVENMLAEVDGKWHYANNILYNAKDRLVNDKVLNASIEDYAKSQTAKINEQKRFEDNKIDQEGLNAFYRNEKRYNTKGIQLDENGQPINRWVTPTPPTKVDTTKKVLEITELLSRYKDSLAVPGTDLLTVYKNNPYLQGMVDKFTNKGKDPSKLGEAVQNWINSTPEVKQYYDYINDSKVFDFVTEKDANGNYLQDENGEFIQRDLTPGDFRDIGIPILDNWMNQSNTMLLPELNGTLQTIKINNLAPNLKDSPLYKQYREQGLNDKQATQQLYRKTLTDLETNKIVDFARSFGYSEIEHDVIKNEMFFYNLKRRDELDKTKDLYFITPGVTTTVKVPTYNSKETQDLIGQLIKERNSITTDPILQKPEDKHRYNELDYEIKNLQNKENLLRKSYLNTIEGGNYINKLFDDFVDKARNKRDKEIIIRNKDKVINYLSGQTEELGFEIPSYFVNKERSAASPLMQMFGYDSLSDIGKINEYTVSSMARTGFNNALTNAIQKDGLEISYDTGILTDNDGFPSKSMEALTKFIQYNASEFNIINQAAKNKNRRETLGQLIDKDLEGKNVSLYDFNLEVPKGKKNDGKFFLRITPKVTGGGEQMAKPLEQDTYVIEPNPINKPEVMRNLAGNAIQNDVTGVGSDWGKQQYANTLYRHYFEDIENSLSKARELNPDIRFTDLGEQYFTNVPMSDGNLYNFKLVPTETSLLLYQLDNNGTPQGTPTIFKSLEQVEDSFKEAFFKE